MTAGGMHHVEGPRVCPFVALESDRDRRLNDPDHRHRCYAEPTPAPRAIAHQQAYCLSPGFTLCPIFQDWAGRAAASPIVSQAAPDESVAAAVGPEQLGAFDGPPVEPGPSGPEREWPSLEPPRPSLEPPPPSLEPPPVPEIPPLPAFLASRERPPATAETPPMPPERQTAFPSFDEEMKIERLRSRPLDEREAQRDAIVPPWEREQQFSPSPRVRARVGRGEGSDIVGRMTTILAVLALLSLALLLLVFAPGFLGDGSPTQSVPVGGASPTTGPQESARASPTQGPAATPVTYTIRPGDSLFGIARRNGLTLEQLLAANPQITNPNLVQAGQVIIIPPLDFGLPTPPP